MFTDIHEKRTDSNSEMNSRNVFICGNLQVDLATIITMDFEEMLRVCVLDSTSFGYGKVDRLMETTRTWGSMKV
jgi:hypothetical protein